MVASSVSVGCLPAATGVRPIFESSAVRVIDNPQTSVERVVDSARYRRSLHGRCLLGS